tara:strand:+ start:626 stop:808 length:183 start_codon:yes stop_codon:yes gene_type:complete
MIFFQIIKFLMKNNFSTNEILEAIEVLLENKIEKKVDRKEIVLPSETELIITQAENFIKK